MEARGPQGAREGSVTSLIFPTYNPGPGLASTWQKVRRFMAVAPGHWEILFVCDGCTDGTPERLRRWAEAAGGLVRVLSHSPNRGKGYAVRQGLLAATGRYRLFTDVDLAYSFEDILRVARALWAGQDVVVGARLHPESRLVLSPQLQRYAYRRHLQSLVFSRLARWLLPLHQADTQAGLKGMSAEVAEQIVPRLRCDGFGFDCELLAWCACLGVSVAEVPVTVRLTQASSTTGMRHAGRMLQELWDIRRSLRRRRPVATSQTNTGACPVTA